MQTTIRITGRQWLTTSIIAGLAVGFYFGLQGSSASLLFLPVAIVASGLAGLPALLVISLLFSFLKSRQLSVKATWQWWIFILLLACLPYGLVVGFLSGFEDEQFETGITNGLFAAAGLWACNLFAVILNYQPTNRFINSFASPNRSFYPSSYHPLKNNITMQTEEITSHKSSFTEPPAPTSGAYNKILIKAGITAGLILAMLIPASYISKLVDEREERHEQVVNEISEKWAAPQTITTPYLVIPYLRRSLNDTGKLVTVKDKLYIAAKSLEVNGSMEPEVRKRSIYEVLLYRSDVSIKGNFSLVYNSDIKPEDLLLNEASFCLGITDLQGIEEKITASFNNTNFDLEPGLPVHNISKQGLSVPISLTIGQLTSNLPFSLNVKLKGSGQLHFLPLSEASTIAIQSTWPNPSFDGSVIPSERDVTDKGFSAKWRFNKGNMPLITQLNQGKQDDDDHLSFGVSMVQPADQYAKTNRSVKYAILFIGLSFAMFFITELVQTRPVHPVQYILIGLALVIFYTLLLSIGEFTGFNIAYGIAASSTILLVAMYAAQLFKSLSIGGLLGGFLGMLYGYIYILIQLEDTALLAGSIGLFVLLAIAMQFSRKINWYGNTVRATPATS